MRKIFILNGLTVSSLLILCSALLGAPNAIAQMEEPNETRIEKYDDLTETEMDTTPESDMSDMETMTEDSVVQDPETRTEETLEEAQSSDRNMYDVRRTEAFNLVSSAYRGDFEEQGINSYAVLVNNYETGELTAEDLIEAAIDAGELSTSAMEDASYVEAVDAQLDALTNS